MFFVILGFAAMLKAFYTKVNPGEVLILNTLAAEPMIVRTGTLIYPVIYSTSTMSLHASPINLESDLIQEIKERYEIRLSSVTVQINDSDESILKAYKRINASDIEEQHRQLSSIVNEAVVNAIKTKSIYEDFKNELSNSLEKVGYELVV
ncbi:hypothetical protein A9Q99_24370 [Gammaproteobacteria bacterium 45_16_T64]|nr:hypothetical protein A9Q99_24370 [Gammaproteobacteria bacterium 45_16_T64]